MSYLQYDIFLCGGSERPVRRDMNTLIRDFTSESGFRLSGRAMPPSRTADSIRPGLASFRRRRRRAERPACVMKRDKP